MTTPWPRVPLGEVLRKSDDWVAIDPEATYSEVTVRLWGKGVTRRGEISGAAIAGGTRLRVRPRQFIASRIDARNGAFGLIPADLDGAVVTNDFPVFVPDEARLVPEFLAWMSKTREFVDLCRAASEGTTNRVRLKEDKFLATPISLPPVSEQRRVVGRIDAIAGRVSEAGRLRAEAEAELQAMLTAAYARIAADAPRRPMGEVAPLVRRPVAVVLTDSYPELGIRSFGKGTFHKPPLAGAEVGGKRLYSILPGDMVFNNVFAWEGAIAIAQPADVGRFGSHRFITCVPNTGVATSRFLQFHFLAADGIEQIREASPGGAGRNRTLGLEALARLPVPVPAFAAQLWFDAVCDRAAALRAVQAEAAAELDALLPAVIDRAFRGEL